MSLRDLIRGPAPRAKTLAQAILDEIERHSLAREAITLTAIEDVVVRYAKLVDAAPSAVVSNTSVRELIDALPKPENEGACHQNTVSGGWRSILDKNRHNPIKK